MNGGHNKKSVRVEFVMSEAEAELVKERMAELGITNLSAYLDVYKRQMTAPYSPEKSPKFLLALDWKYRMGMRDISFPVPAWR